MLNFDNFLKRNFLTVLVLSIFTLLMLHGPQHYTDSETYLNATLIRSPLYPFLIDIFRFFCGSSFEYWLVAFQLTIGGWAIYLFCSIISRQLFLSPLGFIVTLALAASPYFGLSIQTGNAILGEGIAYPLFLFAIYFLIRGLTEKSFRFIGSFVLFSFLLVLTRKQFLFLYPIAFLIIGHFLFCGGGRLKVFYLLMILFLGGFSVSFIEYANNYLRRDHFAPTSYTGIQLVTMAVYVSKSTDILVIRDEQQAKLFQHIYSRTNQKRITLDTLDAARQNQFLNKFQHFFTNYPDIMTEVIDAVENVYLSKTITRDEGQIIAERETTRLAFTLIKENPKRYAMMYLLNVFYGLGGHGIGDGYSVRGNYFVLLQLVAAVFLCKYLIQYPKKMPIAIVFIFLLLLHFSNIAQVALVVPALDRYTFYTSTVLMVFLTGLISKGIEGLAMRRSS